MTDPVKEYGKYKTARRNVTIRYEKRIGLLEVELEAKLKELDDGLSPAAKRIRDAAEAVEVETAADVLDLTAEDPRITLGSGVEELTIPARLLEEPPAIPPGALIEGREKRA
jgi:hypothetical protein